MSGMLLIIGIIWLVVNLAKEASTKPIPPDTDMRRVYIDSMSNGVCQKEIDRRIRNGYYAKTETTQEK